MWDHKHAFVSLSYVILHVLSAFKSVPYELPILCASYLNALCVFVRPLDCFSIIRYLFPLPLFPCGPRLPIVFTAQLLLYPARFLLLLDVLFRLFTKDC